MEQNGSGPKVAVVTGAGSGIGRAAALALLSRGHRVVLAGRREARLLQTRDAASGGPGEVLVVPTDVTDDDAVRRLFEATVERFGRVDVLFNNAGAAAPGAVDEVRSKAWRAVLEVNVTGSFLCAAEAVRRMTEQQPQGGRIINNGSISAHSPRPRSTAYTTSKHAISGLTRCIELDGRAAGVRCSQIDIGNADTEMAAPMKNGIVQADGSVRAEPMFDPAYVGKLVADIAELPLGVTMPWVTIAAAGMPFIGRG